MSESFEVRRPGTGERLGSLPVQDAQDVAEAVDWGRIAQSEWIAVTVRQRARRMRALGRVMEARADEIAETVTAETGKPAVEALTEVAVSVDLIGYYARHAPRHLARRRVSPGWMPWKGAYVEREPLGVIGVITPWNYPLILAMDCVSAALYAGNAVVLKPSELTPLTTLMLPELCRQAGLPSSIVSVVTGDGRTGEALVRSGVDRVVFTGSTTTGRKVLAAASESLTPVTLELGGKDPAIVLADADLERAARGIAFGAFFNAGQTCISVERVYVERPAFDAFVERVAELASTLRSGLGEERDLGPMTSAAQFRIVHTHVQEALAAGARAVAGADPADDGTGTYPPTVLVDVDDSMAVMREETFGPVLPVVPFDDVEDAVRRANDTPYGLTASVWTRDRAKGLRVARRLRAGTVSVNDSLSHYGVPGLPMGGVASSGFGSRRGLEALDEMTRPRAFLIDRLGRRREPWWFPYGSGGERLVRAVLAWRAHGGLAGLIRAGARLAGRG